jgi:hypothetical protein
VNQDQDDSYDHGLVKFVVDIRKEDLLGTVMRAQMHIEHELRQFILANAVSPSHTKCDQLDFGGLTVLAMILGFNSEIKPALAALGALQRKFTRNPHMNFGPRDADNFYNTLGPTLKPMVGEIYNEYRVRENLVVFNRQSPATRLSWFLIGIWSAVSTDRRYGPVSPEQRAKLPEGYLAGLDERRSGFIELLDGGDDLQVVIRAHTHLEHELREFVSAAAPRPDAIKPSDYDYAGTLRLALTLGLDTKFEAGLAAVGALRNKFAHRLGMKLTAEEANKVYAALDETAKAEVHMGWSAAYLAHPSAGRPPAFLEAKPVDVLASSMVALFQGLMLAHLKARRAALREI